MKVFKSNEPMWGDKVNFVDENNVVVGFDMGANCCERFGYMVLDAVIVSGKDLPDERGFEQDFEFEGWAFDPDYFTKLDYLPSDDSKYRYNAPEEGGVAVFRMVNGDQDRFLHLFNAHNGYYSHGFTLDVGGQRMIEDVL